MFQECRHIMPSGAKCQAPALRDQSFCYFHTRLHRFAAQPPIPPDGTLRLPILEDRGAIQIAIAQVFDALCSSRIDARRASLFLYGIQIASQNVMRGRTIVPDTAVRSLTQTDGGEELGPEESACEIPEDCAACANRGTCVNYRRA